MTASYIRTKISDSIGYTSILDSKFKTNTIKVRFLQSLCPEKASAYALAGSLLATSNKNLPTLSIMSKKMSMLYGASISLSVSKQGDLQIITMTISAIDDKYALNGESVLNEILQILLDCLFNPNAEDNVFDKTMFNVKQKDLFDTIDAEINNKRGYVIQQASKTIFKDEPASYSCYGTKEQVLNLTPENVYSAYKEMLNKSMIEIYFVGASPKPAVEEAFKKAFSSYEREAVPVFFRNESKIKEAPVTVTEKLPVNQCKMVLGFKVSDKNLYAVKMMNLIYGQTPFSKLFANVREKLSLCYYCASNYIESKYTLMVDSGVEKENIEKAKTEILHQLDEVKAGNFTDEEIENARMSALNSVKGIGDTPSSYVSWHFTGLSRGKFNTIEEEAEVYKNVTREEIIKAANSVKLDTIYIMEQEDSENE